jgi:hypothetical protein
VVRRRLAWGFSFPLAVIGSQAAHAVGYRLVVPDAARRAHVLAESGHGYLAWMPLVLGLATAMVGLAFVSQVRRGVEQTSLSLWRFAAVAPVLFVCQELFERLLHDGVFPFGVVAEPVFLVGLVAQVPFALAAFLVARVLLRAARAVVRLLGRIPRPVVSVLVVRPVSVVASPRRRFLASARLGRGPPVLVFR